MNVYGDVVTNEDGRGSLQGLNLALARTNGFRVISWSASYRKPGGREWGSIYRHFRYLTVMPTLPRYSLPFNGLPEELIFGYGFYSFFYLQQFRLKGITGISQPDPVPASGTRDFCIA